MLEGGYQLPALARSAANVDETLVGLPDGRLADKGAPSAHP